MTKPRIKKISVQTATNIIFFAEPAGLFYVEEGTKLIAIDNTQGFAVTQEFSSLDKAKCLKWLKGEYRGN